MSLTERENAIKLLTNAFVTGVSTPAQLTAALEATKPSKVQCCKTVFDAVGIERYPDTPAEKRQQASTILAGLLKEGNAPKAIVDYATHRGYMMGYAHQVAVNHAFNVR